MTNTLTVEQLQELLQIQKEFDDRIETKNPEDTHKAFVEEFFEWYNTIEPFKNWKKNKGKPIELQLDELSDMLAFGLSYALMTESYEEPTTYFCKMPELANQYSFLAKLHKVISVTEYRNQNKHYERTGDLEINHILDLLNDVELIIPFQIAVEYYSIDQLIDAYKKKMEHNHLRQDGTADQGKGYV
ncbi:dUTPase [Staphylococcus haemolyticus]|uniref:dUTPase n=1 Tax=Staphylococcus haemolyticus TaxID=1283 RepID=UPI001C6641A8|nr:dUTPase [Staphylococcus haemolyticus]MBW5905587.1 dUTP diphosphatase [Staphylococcus haemolyticus]